MKDRIVKNIFDKAEQNGLLSPGGTVVAASSGNTGAAVAMMAAMRGYEVVITTSPKCSEDKAFSSGLTLLNSKSHPQVWSMVRLEMPEINLHLILLPKVFLRMTLIAI